MKEFSTKDEAVIAARAVAEIIGARRIGGLELVASRKTIPGKWCVEITGPRADIEAFLEFMDDGFAAMDASGRHPSDQEVFKRSDKAHNNDPYFNPGAGGNVRALAFDIVNPALLQQKLAQARQQRNQRDAGRAAAAPVRPPLQRRGPDARVRAGLLARADGGEQLLPAGYNADAADNPPPQRHQRANRHHDPLPRPPVPKQPQPSAGTNYVAFGDGDELGGAAAAAAAAPASAAVGGAGRNKRQPAYRDIHQAERVAGMLNRVLQANDVEGLSVYASENNVGQPRIYIDRDGRGGKIEDVELQKAVLDSVLPRVLSFADASKIKANAAEGYFTVYDLDVQQLERLDAGVRQSRHNAPLPPQPAQPAQSNVHSAAAAAASPARPPRLSYQDQRWADARNERRDKRVFGALPAGPGDEYDGRGGGGSMPPDERHGRAGAVAAAQPIDDDASRSEDVVAPHAAAAAATVPTTVDEAYDSKSFGSELRLMARVAERVAALDGNDVPHNNEAQYVGYFAATTPEQLAVDMRAQCGAIREGDKYKTELDAMEAALRGLGDDPARFQLFLLELQQERARVSGQERCTPLEAAKREEVLRKAATNPRGQEDAALQHGGAKPYNVVDTFSGNGVQRNMAAMAETWGGRRNQEDEAAVVALRRNLNRAQAPVFLQQQARALDAKVLRDTRAEKDTSGATGIMTHIGVGGVVTTASAGDARACMMVGDTVIPLSHDQKPDHEREMGRIQANGGSVSVSPPDLPSHILAMIGGAPRVNGDLATARAFGDENHKKGSPARAGDGSTKKTDQMSAEPDIGQFDVAQHVAKQWQPGQEIDELCTLVVACDGQFDHTNENELLALQQANPDASPEELARQFRNLAFANNSNKGDNITSVVVQFRVIIDGSGKVILADKDRNPLLNDMVATVFDGHGGDMASRLCREHVESPAFIAGRVQVQAQQQARGGARSAAAAAASAAQPVRAGAVGADGAHRAGIRRGNVGHVGVPAAQAAVAAGDVQQPQLTSITTRAQAEEAQRHMQAILAGLGINVEVTVDNFVDFGWGVRLDCSKEELNRIIRHIDDGLPKDTHAKYTAVFGRSDGLFSYSVEAGATDGRVLAFNEVNMAVLQEKAEVARVQQQARGGAQDAAADKRGVRHQHAAMNRDQSAAVAAAAAQLRQQQRGVASGGARDDGGAGKSVSQRFGKQPQREAPVPAATAEASDGVGQQNRYARVHVDGDQLRDLKAHAQALRSGGDQGRSQPRRSEAHQGSRGNGGGARVQLPHAHEVGGADAELVAKLRERRAKAEQRAGAVDNAARRGGQEELPRRGNAQHKQQSSGRS